MSDKAASPRRSAARPSPRAAALTLIAAVRAEGRMLSEARSGLTGPEDARARRLAALALRHAGRADALIAARTRKAPPPAARDAIRLGLAEIHEGGGAAHGVVNDLVAILKRGPAAKAGGLANAILRQVAPDDWAAAPPARMPTWLRGRLVAAWGAARVAAIERAHLAQPPLDLTPAAPADAPAWAERLGAEPLPTGSLRHPGGQVTALPGYEAGAWWVQDAAASLPARLIEAGPGWRVLDLCAAPGGKTMQLAAAGADVTALDISEARMTRLRENLARTGLSARVVVADALDWAAEAPFDAVLLDAPCSATGTIRRHPDLPHRPAPDIRALASLQAGLIDRALDLARPGGAVVYCTCSLLPAEGERQVEAALARHPGLRADPLDPDALGLPAEAAAAHGLRTTPEMWASRGGIGGFYIARLRREGGA
jgi:16S rRNA (cytosine967-C5)-methyltransferase